jgi:nitrite reductase/ring-hydroxylating ferredoxin subunit
MNKEDAEQQWHDLAAVDDVLSGEMTAREVNGLHVALYNVGGTLFATDNICPHGEALLTDGYLDDTVVECPLHGAQFDICNGMLLCGPAEADLRSYSIRVTDGRIQVLLPISPT